MERNEFADATLLVLAHGSTLNAESAAPARLHAARLRERGLFAAVRECFWQQEPKVAGVVAAATTARVFIVPLFIGEGYFVDEAIPWALGYKEQGQTAFARVRVGGGSTAYYCHPVGTHPGMTDVLLARARDVVERHPFPRAPKAAEMALFIVGHGTERTSASRLEVERQVGLIRERGEYAEVHATFLEDTPRISECYEMAVSRNIVVVPFFISDGLHVVEDIPVLLGEAESAVQRRLKAGLPTWRNPTEREGKLVWCARGIGHEPLLTEVIVERVREAVAWRAGSAHSGGGTTLLD